MAETPGGGARPAGGAGCDVIITVVSSPVQGGEQSEFRLSAEVISLGRSDECDVVLASQTVSRRHAEIRHTPEGYRLVDCGSVNGVWIGTERVSEHPLTDGSEFRLGGVLLRFALVPAGAAAPSAPPPAARESAPAVAGAPAPAPPPPAASPATPAEQELSPSAAPAAPTPAADAGASSRSGAPAPRAVEVAGIPVVAPAAPPAPVQAAPPAAPPAAVAPSSRRVAPAAVAGRIAEPAESLSPGGEGRLAELFRSEGDLVMASGNEPFLLDGKDNVWFVEDGKVEVFTVALEGGQPAGSRSHFVSIAPGQVMLGMDLSGFRMGSGFLAVGRMGTRLRRLSITRLEQLVLDPRYAPELAAALDAWVAALSHALTRDFAGPVPDVVLQDGEVTVENQKRARPARGITWVELVEGNLLFVGMEELHFDLAPTARPGAKPSANLAELFGEAARHRLFFPLTSDTWVEASNARDQASVLRCAPAAEKIADPALWRGLDTFHEVLCRCEFINKKLAVVDEFNRLKSKAEYATAARVEAMREIALVLEKPSRERAETLRVEGDPLLVACRLVGEALGVGVRDHPEANKQAALDLRLAAIARASHFRTRVVALRDDWWRHDHGPVLATFEETGNPVALLPAGPRAYTCVDPRAGTRASVDAALASRLSPFGFVFYRPFPEGELTATGLVKFGIRGLKSDLWTLIAMGLTIGALGSLTPYFTGRMFDTAIPQADRSLLVQFTIGLFVAALVAAAFKITQSIAVLRIQGKMDYSIQAALWDRLLNLPSTFFRQFSAGDLADRAGGIDAIRSLIAGAGIAAVLGSISSVFYVVLMFKYSMKLALLGMGLTFLFVGVTSVANYMQLRFQREQMQVRGRITGLVLQLVSGVGKLRVAGAENHAFRVWAHEFSGQRRLEFKAGQIRNTVQVFGAGFSIVSSIAVFFTLVMVQAKAAAEGVPAGMTTGDFIAFTAAYGAFLTAMQSLSEASLNLLRVVPIYERLKPILTAPPETDESKNYPGRLRGELEISNVYFRYSQDGPWVVNDLSVKIRPGEFIAFVGASGCGKSTLMRLLLGFEVPERGAIFYDGQDLANLDLREVRQQIGVVLQDSKLLPVDIFRNIVGVATDLTLDDAWEAARLAGLEDEVRAMPMGMHTYVSEGGGGFSGGQQQKLLIARALVRRPRFLIFDEATSALDNRSQTTVMESVEKLQATRIVIAHRLSTIINADRICYLEAGRIIEMGTYEELMKLDGGFALLAKRQMA